MSLPDLLLLSEYGCHPLAQDTRVQHSRIIYNTTIARGLQLEPDNLNGTPETNSRRDEPAAVRSFSSRRRGYVRFTVGFLHEQNNFIQISIFSRDYTLKKM